MSDKNEDYWYNIWHTDFDLHKKMFIKNVEQITEGTVVSVYGDTDSIFVGFEPAIKSCEWKNNIFNEDWLNKCPHPYRIISKEELNIDINNPNYKGIMKFRDPSEIPGLIEGEFEIDGENTKEIPTDFKLLIIDGSLLKNWNFSSLIENFDGRIVYNWADELEFIHGLDHYKIADYFKEMLDDHASKYGVENVEDFELEKISESIINLEKKKYIQHISWEDGINHERFSYLQPKGVELVRSSTPQFARDKEMGIYRVVNYLFKHPDTFNIKELIKIVKEMRREFELADVNDIAGQSSCSKYSEKVENDKTGLEFVTGAHFAVKAAAYHNYLLHKNVDLQTRYEFFKSGDKVKYYYAVSTEHPIFAFKRGEYPIEFAPPVDYDVQFDKVILSPINSIIKKLGMPEINKRLSVIMDIFGNL